MRLARRLGEGLLLIAALGLGYTVAALLSRIARAPADRLSQALHAWGGQWLAAFCGRHGALLVKLGQFVASRPDIFPLAYTDACAGLRDQVPARSLESLRPTLLKAYEGRMERHLAEIDPVPLAAASFGQVHRATLADGSRVAVKIQYPDLGASVACDLFLVRIALVLFRVLLPGWPLHLVAEEITRTSREEQDYLQEGRAAERLRPILARHGIRVPAVLWAHTRERVLVMEFAAGTTLARTDLRTLSPERRQALATQIIEAWIDQLLDAGLVHGDPHAGNLLLDGDTLWCLDFGMTVTVDAAARAGYRRFLIRLVARDVEGMVDALSGLGVQVPGHDRGAMIDVARELLDEVGDLGASVFKGSRREAEISARVAGFLRNARGIVFARHVVVVSRGLGLVEGLCAELVPERNFLALATPTLKRIAGPRYALHMLREEAQRIWSDFRSIPRRLDELAGRRDPPFPTGAFLAGLALLAALQLDHGLWRDSAAIAAGLAMALALLRRG